MQWQIVYYMHIKLYLMLMKDTKLNKKIEKLKSRREALKIGSIELESPYILGPMSAITNAPFRLLMQDLGAGASISELISCYGINYKNQKTLNMLKLAEREKNIGLQLFGDNKIEMAKAATVAEEYGASFIDINMGCPVKKVVKKGGGSALLKDIKSLESFFKTIKKSINIPLTIKIRIGWDINSINAHEVIKIATDCGIEWISVHGRTRCQQYKGHSNWELLETLAKESSRVIGNGDLHSPTIAKNRLLHTNCSALMIARGALHFPFIFLECYLKEDEDSPFDGNDYFSIIQRYFNYLCRHSYHQRSIDIQLKKIICYFSYGFNGAVQFREMILSKDISSTIALEHSQKFFTSLSKEDIKAKLINCSHSMLLGGHG